MEKYQLLNIINARAGELFTLCDLDNFVMSLGDFESVFEHATAKDFIDGVKGGSMSYALGNIDNIPERLNVEFEVVRWSADDLEIVVELKGAELL